MRYEMTWIRLKQETVKFWLHNLLLGQKYYAFQNSDSIWSSGDEPSQFPPFTCLTRLFQLEENNSTRNIHNHYIEIK